MTLKENIEKITGNKLTVNEALSFTNAQWGLVCNYIRTEDKARIKELEERDSNLCSIIQSLQQENEQLKEVLESVYKCSGESRAIEEFIAAQKD